ncbi:MAG: hypothetical protein AAGH99_08515 [Planctomycetota bacterium]
MRAAASFPADQSISSRTATRPVVFIDGLPEPMLAVSDITWTGRLNRCSASIKEVGSGSVDEFSGQSATIALPRSLNDGQIRWEVLTHGRLLATQKTEGPKEYSRAWKLVDTWSGLLEGSTALFDLEPATGVQQTAQNLSVGEGLQTVSQAYGAELNLGLIPKDIAESPLLRGLRTDGPLGSTLEPIVNTHGLFIQRDLRWSGNQISERRTVRALACGRRIEISPPSSSRPSPVIEFRSGAETLRAHLWTARGGRPQIESTFTLRPGWNPALEGRADGEYDRSLNPEFSRLANVYRLWVLNEDGLLPNVDAYDLAALFNQPGLPASPLRFESCLTLDDMGRPLLPIVEFSVDGGSHWSRYTDPVRLLDGPAGLALDSVALPIAVLAAARAGELRIRITASLISPEPMQARRWQGNPFTNVGPEVRLDASAAFTVHRVTPGSLHAADIQTGRLTANIRDDTQSLNRWLLEQIDRDSASTDHSQFEARVTLSNARPELRIGDRIRTKLFNHHSSSNTDESASVLSIRCDFVNHPKTTLTLRR